MALKKKDGPQDYVGNQGYQEGNEGEEHDTPEGQKQDLDGQGGKKVQNAEPIGSEARTKGHR